MQFNTFSKCRKIDWKSGITGSIFIASSIENIVKRAERETNKKNNIGFAFRSFPLSTIVPLSVCCIYDAYRKWIIILTTWSKEREQTKKGKMRMRLKMILLSQEIRNRTIAVLYNIHRISFSFCLFLCTSNCSDVNCLVFSFRVHGKFVTNSAQSFKILCYSIQFQ